MIAYFKRISEYQLKTQGQFKEEIPLLAHHIGMYSALWIYGIRSEAHITYYHSLILST